MAQVYGAGGKTYPKKGRNGTGSYYPQGTPIYLGKGNTFPGIQVTRPEFEQVEFGFPGRAGISTVVGQNRRQTPANHPNQSFYNTATIPQCPPMIVSSSNERKNLQPVPPAKAVLVMPHERNTNSASGTKKTPMIYRTAFGVSSSMVTDTAFQRNPTATYSHTVRQRPNHALEAVKKVADVRTFARASNPLPVKGGVNPDQQHRTPPPSFFSNGNHWTDPHNSFIAGKTSIAGAGVGRWATVKKGVITFNRVQGGNI